MPFFPVGSTLPSCSSALRDCWNLAVPTRDAMCSMESSLKEASFNRFRIEFAGTRVTRPMTGAEIWHLRLGGYPESRAKKDEADACAGILSEARYRTGRWGSSGGMGAIPRSSTGWGLGKGSAADAWITSEGASGGIGERPRRAGQCERLAWRTTAIARTGRTLRWCGGRRLYGTRRRRFGGFHFGRFRCGRWRWNGSCGRSRQEYRSGLRRIGYGRYGGRRPLRRGGWRGRRGNSWRCGHAGRRCGHAGRRCEVRTVRHRGRDGTDGRRAADAAVVPFLPTVGVIAVARLAERVARIVVAMVTTGTRFEHVAQAGELARIVDATARTVAAQASSTTAAAAAARPPRQAAVIPRAAKDDCPRRGGEFRTISSCGTHGPERSRRPAGCISGRR